MLENETDSHIDHLFHTEDIGEAVIESLILDRNINETKAADLFFASDTFAQLSDRATGLYLKPWQEIYEMLKKELKT
jgi:hypothetical protein